MDNLKVFDKKIVKQKKSSSKKIYLPITAENIEEQHRLVEESANYGKEGLIIREVLNAYPKHDDYNRNENCCNRCDKFYAFVTV